MSTPRIIACLAWFEESPTWLAALVASLAGVCDHVVAADGAYAIYPGANRCPRSGPEQADAIHRAADAIGIGATVHVPHVPWAGGEVEKRTWLFQAAAAIAPDGWAYVIDADEIVSHAPADLHARLADTDLDVGAITLWWRDDLHATALKAAAARQVRYPQRGQNIGHRALFRLLHGLRCQGAHYVNVAERDGHTIYLRGRNDLHQLEPELDLTDMRVEHRHAYRARERMEQAAEYARMRDQLGVEELEDRDIYTRGVDGQPVLVASKRRQG